MTDLIDRDAVLSDINEEIVANQEYPEDKLIRKGLRIAREAIENALTVNCWIPGKNNMYYCPNCGAKMTGGVDNANS